MNNRNNSNFVEPTILCRCERPPYDGQGNTEGIQLEMGEFENDQGEKFPVFAFRAVWKGNDGVWRWSQQRASQSGKYWSRIGIKARELREMGAALLEAAEQHEPEQKPQQQAPRQQNRARPAPARGGGAQPGFQGKPSGGYDDDEIPF